MTSIRASRSRIVDLAIISGCTALAAWAILPGGLARQAIVDRRPAAAIRAAPFADGVVGLRAEQALARGDTEEAARLADAALARSPLDTIGTRVAAQVAERRGDAERARRLMEVGGRLGWRDLPTQKWIFAHALANGDAPTAMMHADALLRQAVDRGPVLRALGQALEVPAMRDAIASTLATAPPWRPAFFAESRGIAPTLWLTLADVAEALEGTAHPLTAREAGAAVASPVARTQDVAGWVLLHKLASARATVREPLLRDGGFDRAADPARRATNDFEWAFPVATGGQGAIDAVAGSSGPALRLDDAGDDRPIALQILVLPPGAYRLGWSMRAEALSGSVRMTVTCRTASLPAFASAAVDAPQGWATRRIDFTVPARCPSQMLSLQPTGGGKSIWIDSVQLTRRDRHVE